MENIKDPVQRYFHCFCKNLQEYLECASPIYWPRWLQEDWRDLSVDLPILKDLDKHWGKDSLSSFLEEIKSSFEKKKRMEKDLVVS